jgi:Nuclease-related domain/TadE-like protein
VTRRVVECHVELARLEDRSSRERPPRRGLVLAACCALVLVPIAGATEQPVGWLSAGGAAMCVLLVFRLGGRTGAVGWLLLLVGLVSLAAPRGIVPGLGPAAFVTLALLAVLWLANRGVGRRSPNGWREREAQQVAGRSGEIRVAGILAGELPDEYVLINGLALPRGAGDIDHLVIGPNGVFLLETKTMAGRIVCQPDGTWQRTRVGRGGTTYVAYIGDPAAQVQRNIYAVRECLRRRLPHLYAAQPLWLEGILVFPHPRTELATEHSRIPAVRLADLARSIRGHQPRRMLQPSDVGHIAEVLLGESHARPLARSAQALVEMALALPVVLTLVFGTVALSRVVQAHSAIVAIAHEVARAGALGASSADALARMQLRAHQVTPGLGLDATLLDIVPDVSAYGRNDGHVAATVRYLVNLGDVPLVGWAPPPELRVRHVEWIDPFRGGIDDATGER